jgi:hypothetical protein
MIAIGSSALSRLATAWPPSIAPLAMGSERKRSTAWFLRSLASAKATPNEVNTIVWAKIPPIRNSR